MRLPWVLGYQDETWWATLALLSRRGVEVVSRLNKAHR
jgi:hypothetical protein